MFDKINNQIIAHSSNLCQGVNICHLCLATVNDNNCKTVDDKLQDDLNIHFFCDLKKDTVVCQNCSKKTLGLSNFISTFVQTQHEINDTIISNGVSHVSLNSVYLKRNRNNPGVTISKLEKICMICLNLINGNFKKFYGGEESNLVRYIKKYMSLNVIYIKEPVACEQCYDFLKTLYSFTNNNSFKFELKDNIVNVPQTESKTINAALTEPSTSGMTLTVNKDLFEKEGFANEDLKTDIVAEEVQIGTVKIDQTVEDIDSNTVPNSMKDIKIKAEPVEESVNVSADKNEKKRKISEDITHSADSDSEPESSSTPKTEKKKKLDQILNESGENGQEFFSEYFKADLTDAMKGLQTLMSGASSSTTRTESTSSKSSSLYRVDVSQKCLTTVELVSNITKHYSDTFKRITKSKEKCMEKVRELDRELGVYRRKLRLIDEVELRIQARFKSRITEAIKDLDSADNE